MIANLDVPVFYGGSSAYVISIALDPARFQHLLEEQHFPEGWLVGLLDRQARFIARLPWGSADIGTSATDASESDGVIRKVQLLMPGEATASCASRFSSEHIHCG